MAVTEHDVEQFAARIRLHFELELRDIALISRMRLPASSARR